MSTSKAVATGTATALVPVTSIAEDPATLVTAIATPESPLSPFAVPKGTTFQAPN